jgi:methionine sulfoxide reductase heme-binding subunit
VTTELTNALWYLGRGTGVVTLALLTLAVVLGIGVRTGRPLAGLPRFGVHELHRSASLLATSLLVVHVTTLLFDPYAQLRLVDLVLPFAGAYRPLWLGLGTLALDMVVAIVVTSLLRQRIGRSMWRAVHWATYGMWPLALLHALGTGTDASTMWLRGVAVACVLGVVAALFWRLTPISVAESGLSGRSNAPFGDRGRTRIGDLP